MTDLESKSGVRRGGSLIEEARKTKQPIPEFDIPVGWYRNDPMCEPDRTAIGLRSECWRYHIELDSASVASDVAGIVAELRVQVGPDDSFVTEPIYRLTDVEPGAVQDAVYLLVGEAVKHEMERESDD